MYYFCGGRDWCIQCCLQMHVRYSIGGVCYWRFHCTQDHAAIADADIVAIIIAVT